jgi:hypothetical protein
MLLPIGEEAGQASESVLTLWGGDKSLAFAGNHPASSLVTVPTELSHRQ